MLMRVLVMTFATAGTVSAQDANPEVGRDIFMSYCAQCHGYDAKGVGPMAEILSVVTPDLTKIAARDNGVFPTDAVAMKIDGRAPVLAHGGDMPLFGPAFEGGNSVLIRLPNGQSMMMSQTMVDLVGYLETVQTQ